MNSIKISFKAFVIITVLVAFILYVIVVGTAMAKQRKYEYERINYLENKIFKAENSSWNIIY